MTHELAYALAEFTTHAIERWDSDDPSARTQLFVKGVFSGASCGSLVEYAKKQRELAYKHLSPTEIEEIKRRAKDGRS